MNLKHTSSFFSFILISLFCLITTQNLQAQVDEQKTPGNFIVVAGSFANEMDAIHFFNKLTIKGVQTYMYYDTSNDRHYVHFGKYYFKEDGLIALKSFKKLGFSVWLKTISQ